MFTCDQLDNRESLGLGIRSHGHNTKGGSNGHFNHVNPTKVNVSSLWESLESTNYDV